MCLGKASLTSTIYASAKLRTSVTHTAISEKPSPFKTLGDGFSQGGGPNELSGVHERQPHHDV
jgi:hypothetical protein